MKLICIRRTFVLEGRLWLSALCLLFAAATSRSQTIPLKVWNEYTEEERATLKDRWTSEQVQQVVAALAAGLPFPDFVTKLPPSAGSMGFADDLRGISLNGAEMQRANLSYACLQLADLFGANLQDADLTEANLDSCSLRSADLSRARLGRAVMTDANLESARMPNADLSGAAMNRANLSSAVMSQAILTEVDLRGATLLRTDLRQANLQNCSMPQATLREADLQDADLFQARFDSTYLYQVQLGKARNIRDIRWGDSTSSRYLIGEELHLKTSEDFRRAEVTYRDLKMLYRRELLDDIANEFHYRENEIITNSYPWYSPVSILRLLFLKWTFGYGSRPMWLLWYSIVVVVGFTLIYALLTLSKRTLSGICQFDPGKHGEDTLLEFRGGVLFLDCFYFSLLSLATFGYGALQPRQWLQFFRFQPVEYKPIRWACIFVGIEAGLGIWIFSLLVTVLFGSR
jgi:hypothetical protein